jgi:hypothetical protein
MFSGVFTSIVVSSASSAVMRFIIRHEGMTRNRETPERQAN